MKITFNNAATAAVVLNAAKVANGSVVSKNTIKVDGTQKQWKEMLSILGFRFESMVGSGAKLSTEQEDEFLYAFNPQVEVRVDEVADAIIAEELPKASKTNKAYKKAKVVTKAEVVAFEHPQALQQLTFVISPDNKTTIVGGPLNGKTIILPKEQSTLRMILPKNKEFVVQGLLGTEERISNKARNRGTKYSTTTLRIQKFVDLNMFIGLIAAKRDPIKSITIFSTTDCTYVKTFTLDSYRTVSALIESVEFLFGEGAWKNIRSKAMHNYVHEYFSDLRENTVKNKIMSYTIGDVM